MSDGRGLHTLICAGKWRVGPTSALARTFADARVRHRNEAGMEEEKDAFEEIAEFNQRYLQLVRRLLCEDADRARAILGISNELAIRLVTMTPAQLERLADNGELVCRLRADAMPGRA
ncbi:flagellar transcriptional activator FlhD [Burkholderia thailandensis E264]|uniref:Flagellar transcriptional activator FlhD n=2 Tax=Burkholderia thailandensis TaxID=57975 RepID=Q2SYT8_BURTA|nr:flagellar transcriptional activator FlhD [Burkholderia thailandensis E264]